MTTDHDQLRTLLQRYARAADARDVDVLRELFRPDAVVEGARGRLTRDEWLETMSTPSPFEASMHLIGDPLIEVDPSGDEARLDTYAVVYQLGDRAEDRQDLTLGIRYLDRAARSGSGWVLVDRVARTVWMR